MNKLLFVHVPKTAGTSFRQAAEAYFEKKIALDYGVDAPETSPLVTELIYERGDNWTFYKTLDGQGIRLLGGHFSVRKYLPGMGLRNTIMFLRDPVQRLYSEYRHFVRHKDYTKSFADFYKTPNRINVQSKRFNNLPVEAIGFLGVTERYDSALQMINDNYQLELRSLARNKGRWSVKWDHDIDPADVVEIEQLHRTDREFYTYVCRLFNQREALFTQGFAYVHGAFKGVIRGFAQGWAWWSNNRDDPVELLVRVNGEPVDSVLAKIFRPELCLFSPPRGAYVGFELPVTVKSGDTLDFQVRETGQVFPLEPQVIE